MSPEDIDKIADEIWETAKQKPDDKFEEKFYEFAKQYADENGRIPQDQLILICASFTMTEATRISFNMTVELLKRILMSDQVS